MKKDHDPGGVGVNGHAALEHILAQISGQNAREHYLYKLPRHVALMKAWGTNNLLFY